MTKGATEMNGIHLLEDLAKPSPDWEKVADRHRPLDLKADQLYCLPLEEFRKVPYIPPPLPANVPIPNRDLIIRTEQVVVRDGTSIDVRLYQPIELSNHHLLFFNMHGGGWTVGCPETEEAQNRFVAAKNQAVVCSVDYRKAPEFPFPYALEDSIDVLLWCKKNAETLCIDAQRIVVGGGSAGANLAAAVTQQLHQDGITGIVGQVLNIPVTCHPNRFPTQKYKFRSYAQNAQAPIVSATRMRQFWNNYLPDALPDPKASPLLATSFRDLPPALIQIAGMDPLRDEGLAYALALKHDGVDVTIKIYPGMPHAFYVYPELESTQKYLQAIMEWIDGLPTGKVGN